MVGTKSALPGNGSIACNTNTSGEGTKSTYIGAWYKEVQITGINSIHNSILKVHISKPDRDEFFIPSATELISLRYMTGRSVKAEVSSLNYETLRIKLKPGNAGLYFAEVKHMNEIRIERVYILD